MVNARPSNPDRFDTTDALSARRVRVWRLARLLTDDASTAERVARRVEGRTSIVDLPIERLERLVVFEAREAPPGSGMTASVEDDSLRAARSALIALPRQAREAWTLARLDGLELRRLALAMDCSRSAASVHLERADEAMTEAMGGRWDEAAGAMRRWAENLDPQPYARSAALAQRLRRRRRRLAALVVALVAVATIVWMIT